MLKKHLPLLLFCLLILISITWQNNGESIDLFNRNIAPNVHEWFGTDWLGRDVFSRTLKALLFSLAMGGLSSILCALLSLCFALIGNINNTFNNLINLMVDVWSSLPHILVMIVLSVLVGGGFEGLVIAITLSHWPKLTRLLKIEIEQLRQKPYVLHSLSFGYSKIHTYAVHITPHILPQMLIGMLMLYPQALVHGAGLTFLGFGIEPSTPSMGGMLSEASQYLLSGQWWLALFPGIMLVISSLLLISIGKSYEKSKQHNA
ncbi:MULTISPECIES: ABC transporter permease [Aliivibrio]|uniref:ABC transporter permease subunit n=3 Tax=Aliivibrio fischeri TaxID=668 RepID=A0A1B9PL85_ALIFS|nr:MULTISPECIES: ABC transporter permease [Aliivibrio]ACH66803.1 oligopeptide transport system permease protein OppC [Aliivibrio fischeri MJ11]EHN70904.1 oligopeptide transport system permease OppC [Aliivibrio fischeri SR5]MBD1568359.1 ABC transporter permease [Aliivibrio sp. S10_S31]MCE4936708.1 ABC transporter permease [Aliivibrio fischeri]MUH98562.1 ABC transporter permease subunit [Aliivibrio fischeri]